MGDKRYYVILNANAGTALNAGITPETVAAAFAKNGLNAVIDADRDVPFSKRIAKALESPAEVIVAAGGDGTVTGVAQAVAGTKKSLAILPLGTVNLLARDLKLPLTLDEAVAAMGELEPKRIDVGEVNGRIFLHKVVIGVIPSLAAGREKIRHQNGLGAKIALLRYFMRRLSRARRLAVAIEPEGAPARVERVQALAVGNNVYDEGLGRFFSREHIDRGTLSLYVLRRLNPGDILRLATEMVLGRWQNDEVISVEPVKAVTIRSHKQKLKVMFDGEVETFDVPLTFTIRPLALSVLTPKEVTVARGALDLTDFVAAPGV